MNADDRATQAMADLGPLLAAGASINRRPPVHRKRGGRYQPGNRPWILIEPLQLEVKGMPVDSGSWWKHFQLLARKLGLPKVKPHSFRHKAATTDNRAGVDPNTRMLQRGRVSMESERAVYIHPELLDQHVAAEASHRVFFERRGCAEVGPQPGKPAPASAARRPTS